jgi:repressor LexA
MAAHEAIQATTQTMIRIQPGERIPVPLSQLHRDLILEAFISPELEARIRSDTVSLDLDDLDELIGAVAAEMNHCEDERLRGQWRGLYDHLHAIEERYTDEDLPVTAVLSRLVQPVRYTPKQGQYLAFIYTWTKLHGIAPSEAEMQAYFKVSAPAVHQMVRALEDRGFIERIPRQPRSIRLLIAREELPELE